MTKHILETRIGHLSYECQNPAEVFELEQMNLKGKIDAMEFERFENATSRGFNNSVMSSPRRENFLIERKFTGLTKDEDDLGMKSLSDFNGLFVDEEVPVKVDFEK